MTDLQNAIDRVSKRVQDTKDGKWNLLPEAHVVLPISVWESYDTLPCWARFVSKAARDYATLPSDEYQSTEVGRNE